MKKLILIILSITLALTNCSQQASLWENLNNDDNSNTGPGTTGEGPTIETLAPGIPFLPFKNIVGTSFEGGGKILDEGTSPILDRGICISEDDLNYRCSSAVSISGLMFKILYTEMLQGKDYYIKAYAENDSGSSSGDVIIINSGYEIGAYHEGGLVFQNDGSGHGLVAYEYTATDTSVIIKRTWPDAIDYCNDGTFNGFNDWHLPSLDELTSIKQLLFDRGLGGYPDMKFWSSTEEFDNTPTKSHSLNFDSDAANLCEKNHPHHVIPIRIF